MRLPGRPFIAPTLSCRAFQTPRPKLPYAPPSSKPSLSSPPPTSPYPFPYPRCLPPQPYLSTFITRLRDNYRSHPAILEVPNAAFYHGELRPAADTDLTHAVVRNRWSKEHLPNPRWAREGSVGQGRGREIVSVGMQYSEMMGCQVQIQTKQERLMNLWLEATGGLKHCAGHKVGIVWVGEALVNDLPGGCRVPAATKMSKMSGI